MSERVLRNGENHGLLVLAEALPGASGSLALEGMQKKIAAAGTGGILSSPGMQNEMSARLFETLPPIVERTDCRHEPPAAQFTSKRLSDFAYHCASASTE